jgi:hypothetical protein
MNCLPKLAVLREAGMSTCWDHDQTLSAVTYDIADRGHKSALLCRDRARASAHVD